MEKAGRTGQQRENYTVMYGIGRAATENGNNANAFQKVELPEGLSIAHVEVGHDHTILID